MDAPRTSPSLRSWPETLLHLEEVIGTKEVDAWLRGSRLLGREEGRARIAMPTQLHCERVRQYAPVICEALGVESCDFETLEAEAERMLFDPELALSDTRPQDAAPSRRSEPEVEAGAPLDPALLDPGYTFDEFVVGACNRFAHAAATAVANRPSESFNPLFLHGSVGLGKTHLIQAIAHQLLRDHPRARILYLSCEDFVNHFIAALRQNRIDAFRDRYRNCDLLVVDDIHLLANKQQMQQEFFHTFNALYTARKQIVLSSDAPPQDIPSLQERLVSRFKWGLVAEVLRPDFETRVAILQRKADHLGLALPESLARYVAEHVRDNVRELEGALLQLKATAELNREPLTLKLAHRALTQGSRPSGPMVRMDEILRRVSDHFGIPVDDLRSPKRARCIAAPRQVAMWIARRLTQLSLQEIGRHFGGRDHATVLYSLKKVDERRSVDGDFASLLADLERGLTQ